MPPLAAIGPGRIHHPCAAHGQLSEPLARRICPPASSCPFPAHTSALASCPDRYRYSLVLGPLLRHHPGILTRRMSPRPSVGMIPCSVLAPSLPNTYVCPPFRPLTQWSSGLAFLCGPQLPGPYPSHQSTLHDVLDSHHSAWFSLIFEPFRADAGKYVGNSKGSRPQPPRILRQSR
jgi:hypothetical protein